MTIAEMTSASASGPLLLAADIGGTKTDLAIYALNASPREPLVSGRLPSAQYGGLEPLVGAFLAQHAMTVQYACFDVAGPVVNGCAKLTNLPWTLDEAALQDALGLRAVWLLNDLTAIASAVPYLAPDDLHTLNQGTPVPGGAIAVIAPGTGLGEAFLTWDGARYRAYPSEGGHANFGPINEIQIDLLQYLRRRFDHVSYERVCSGVGMPNVYQFVRDRGDIAESPVVAAQLARTPAHVQAHIIIDAALDAQAPDKLCAAALDIFVSVLGTETANLMLKVLSTGGVYMSGGIATHVIPVLETGTFLQGITSKGRFTDLVTQIPIHVITNPTVALVGAAGYGMEQARAGAARLAI